VNFVDIAGLIAVGILSAVVVFRAVWLDKLDQPGLRLPRDPKSGEGIRYWRKKDGLLCREVRLKNEK